MLVGSVVFVWIGLYIVIDQPVSPIFRNHIYNTVGGLAGILFFGMMVVYLLLKMKDQRPGIVINPIGMNVNAGAASFGLIKWGDIDEVKAIVYYNQDLLLILVKNPEYHIERQNNMINRKGMEMSWKYLATPITISANGLKCNFEELKNIVQEKFQEYGKIKET